MMYMPGIVVGTMNGRANKRGDPSSNTAYFLLQMIKFCLIFSLALNILRSLAIFLMWLIFHPLITLSFLLKFLNIYFATLNLSKYATDKSVQGFNQDFGGLTCKCSLQFQRYNEASRVEFRIPGPDPKPSFNSRVILNKFLSHSKF